MSGNNYGRWGVFSFLSFISVALIGISLLIGYLFGAGNVRDWLDAVAFFLACIVVAYYSFYYACRSNQSSGSRIACILIWAVAITLIVIFKVLPLF